MCLTLTVRIKAQAGVENHKAAGVGADMNERIRELAEQSGLLGPTSRVGNAHEAAERFAELVRQDERENCAKLCEKVHADYINDRNNDGYDCPDGYNCAEAIRARSNNRNKTSTDICGND